MKSHFILLLFASVVFSFNFQSCSMLESDGGEGDTTTSTEEASPASAEATKVNPAKADPVTHQKDLHFVMDKVQEFADANNHKVALFSTECYVSDSIQVDVELDYDQSDNIEYVKHIVTNSYGSSTKHHYFHAGKLIYLHHHNEYVKGTTHHIDDHKTYFKDGEMIRCLEKSVDYTEGEDSLADQYQAANYDEVDCKRAEKLTLDLDKLFALTEDNAKSLCDQI